MSTEPRKVETEYFKELAGVLERAEMRIVTDNLAPGDCWVEFNFFENSVSFEDIEAIRCFFADPYAYVSAFEDNIAVHVCLREHGEEE